MSDVRVSTTVPADRVGDVPRIREAMGEGVREALRRHKQAHNPVAIWRDGAAVWIAPEDIPVDDLDSPGEE